MRENSPYKSIMLLISDDRKFTFQVIMSYEGKFTVQVNMLLISDEGKFTV